MLQKLPHDNRLLKELRALQPDLRSKFVGTQNKLQSILCPYKYQIIKSNVCVVGGRAFLQYFQVSDLDQEELKGNLYCLFC